MSALSPSEQPTVLFSIYQNITWTIRCLVDEMINPAYYIEDCRISCICWLYSSYFIIFLNSEERSDVNNLVWLISATENLGRRVIESIHRINKGNLIFEWITKFRINVQWHTYMMIIFIGAEKQKSNLVMFRVLSRCFTSATLCRWVSSILFLVY